MRATWMVLGTLVAAGAVGYWKLRTSAPGAAETPALEGSVPKEKAEAPLIPERETARPTAPKDGAPPAPSPQTNSPQEVRARELLRLLAEAKVAQDTARIASLENTLKQEAWDTTAARRFAVQSGLDLARAAKSLAGPARVAALDRARHLMSRGVFLHELFDAEGRPSADRTRLLEEIRTLNQQVMAFKPGVEGVTRPYVVPPGKAPVQIVQEEKLRTGHNALLMWNKGGNLDPRRLVAGETLLLPLGELRVEVDVDRRLMVLFLDEVFVKEFRVGVGKAETPTPRGLFEVGKKQENPDWYPPQGGKILAGDPRNELGTVWIHITNAENPSGYGLHGTNKPETVGGECSQGCVRLSNEQASELYWWVRTNAGGGQATKVLIR